MIVLGGVCMFVKDLVGTLMVLAESKGRAVIAATLGIVSDVAAILTYGIGAQSLISHGFSMHLALVIGAMQVGSFCAIIGGTVLGRRLRPDDELATT